MSTSGEEGGGGTYGGEYEDEGGCVVRGRAGGVDHGKDVGGDPVEIRNSLRLTTEQIGARVGLTLLKVLIKWRKKTIRYYTRSITLHIKVQVQYVHIIIYCGLCYKLKIHTTLFDKLKMVTSTQVAKSIHHTLTTFQAQMYIHILILLCS